MDEVEVRAASAAEVLAIAEPLLPHTVQVVADLRGDGPARRTRAHLAHRRGQPLGAIVFGERCRGRWYASPVVLDPAAAEPLARCADHSRAWEIGGSSPHVDPLLPFLTRTERRAPIHEPFYAADIPPGAAPPHPRIRAGRPEDLDALVDLYAVYELSRIPTRPRLREFLRRQLERLPVLVVDGDGDGDLAGGYLCLHRAPGYDMWGDLTIRKEYRRRGLGTMLGLFGVYVSKEVGHQSCGVQAGSNLMPTHERIRAKAAEGVQTRTSVWTQQPLQAPRRFPGHRRLRRAAERVEGRLPRRPSLLPDARVD